MTQQQGAFRGKKFRTSRASTQVGQRRGIYEIPFDDKGVATVALGRKARRYSIEAQLIRSEYSSQSEYERARDELIAAAEDPTPGMLVHPYLGPVMVVPSSTVDISESSALGGICEIRFEAIESRATAAPAPVTQARTELPGVVSRIHTSAASDLAAKVQTAGYPAFLATSHIAAIDSSLASLRQLSGFISAQLSTPGRIAAQLDAIADEIVSLAYAPDRLYAELQHAMEVVFGAIAKVAKATIDVSADSVDTDRVDARIAAGHAALLACSTDLAADMPVASTRDTPAREQERINLGADRVAIRSAQFAVTVDVLNQLEYSSRGEANAILRAILQRADQLLADPAISAPVFAAVDETRALIQLRLRKLSLRASTIYRPARTLPACVIAWSLYGDTDRAEEILARNAVPHPDFIETDTPLEVLVS